MAECVGFAQGEYCWLFSGDDVMRPGAIKRALEWIGKGDDVFLCEHTICNKEMVMLREYPLLSPNQFFCADFSNMELRQEWFKRALSTEAFFSFISGLIVRREKWQSGRSIENFNGSCWGHVARFFDLVPTGLRVCYVAEIWLDQSGGNDSFSDRGVVNRYQIAIDGYHKLADTFFGHASLEAFHIRRVIRNEYGLNIFLYAKLLAAENPATEDIVVLNRIVKMHYGDPSLRNWMRYVLYKIAHPIFLKIAYRLKRWLKKIWK